jgi:hypothetical protein
MWSSLNVLRILRLPNPSLFLPTGSGKSWSGTLPLRGGGGRPSLKRRAGLLLYLRERKLIRKMKRFKNILISHLVKDHVYFSIPLRT